MISKSPFLISRKRIEESGDPLGPELDQITAALQTGQQGIGQWKLLTASDVKFYGDSGMTWTVDASDLSDSTVWRNNLAYMLLGSTLFLQIRIVEFSIGGTVSPMLHMTLPFNLTAKGTFQNVCVLFDNALGTGSLALIRIIKDSNAFDIFRADGANLTASVNNSALVAQIMVEVR